MKTHGAHRLVTRDSCRHFEDGVTLNRYHLGKIGVLVEAEIKKESDNSWLHE